MRYGCLVLLGVAVSIARSDQGKRLIHQARQKYDTDQPRQGSRRHPVSAVHPALVLASHAAGHAAPASGACIGLPARQLPDEPPDAGSG
jgi:hypothetical protein